MEKRNHLYKVTLSYGYRLDRHFQFYVISNTTEEAIEVSIQEFNKYEYGKCIFKEIELIASKGQYAKPDILIIKE